MILTESGHCYITFSFETSVKILVSSTSIDKIFEPRYWQFEVKSCSDAFLLSFTWQSFKDAFSEFLIVLNIPFHLANFNHLRNLDEQFISV